MLLKMDGLLSSSHIQAFVLERFFREEGEVEYFWEDAEEI